MPRFNDQLACTYALERLEKELMPCLYYHSFEHTRSDVVPATEIFGRQSGLDDETLSLALTAASYHDLGWVLVQGLSEQDLYNRTHHEENSARIAGEVLPGFGYSAAQIQQVCGMIMATKLPQSPHSLAEQVVADADLDSLGRNDFFTTSIALRDELAHLGSAFNESTWFSNQLRFLRSHSYFTPAARALRAAGKQANILALERHLNVLQTS